MMIKGNAHLFDMPGLFFAQNVAGTADIHIVAGQRKTGAQTVKRLQNAQPPFGDRFQILLCRHRKIAVPAYF